MRNSLVGPLWIALGVAAVGLGCGDNTRACGEGTVEEGGYCVPAASCGFGTRLDEETGECVPDGSVVCSGGTVFDPLTGTCKVSEAACQNGTVLVGDACVDPTGELVVNLEEGPEPNGLDVIEESVAQAGNIVLAGTFVIHGTLEPFRDLDGNTLLDPDVDTFVVSVTGPTFVRITADGVGGTAAGFLAVAAADATDPMLVDWQRLGLSLVSDTSVREVLLPRAGSYRIAIADTRTLLEYATTGSATAAPGSATHEYYVSLTRMSIPAATELALTHGSVTTTRQKPSDKLEVFRAPLGTGLNRVRVTMPSELAEAAVAVLVNGETRVIGGETGGVATALFGGVEPGDDTLIVVDQVYTLAPTPLEYTLQVQAADATPLSTTGELVSATATANNGSDFMRLNMFSFDVSADDATVGMQLTWSPAVVGQIYDETGQRVAAFTDPAMTATWSTYRGLVRLQRAGRYYAAVFAPTANSMTTLDVTSTITELTPAPIVFDTPLTAAISSFRVSPFTYDAGTTVPWQLFDVSGTNTGGQFVSWFDPATAYGRLDTVDTSSGPLPTEVMPIFTASSPAGGAAAGRVLLSDPTPHYYVKVNALSPTSAPTATLTFSSRPGVADLGTLTSGMNATLTGEVISPSEPQRFYLVRIPEGSTVQIAVTPTSNVNTQLQRLAADESGLGPIVNANGTDTETFTQNDSEWTAFVVSAAGPLNASRTYDVSVQIQ